MHFPCKIFQVYWNRMLYLLQGCLSEENEEPPDDEINHFVLPANTIIPDNVLGLDNANLSRSIYETENLPHNIENTQVEDRNYSPTVQGRSRESLLDSNDNDNEDDFDLEHRNTINNDLSRRDDYLNDDDSDDNIDDDTDNDETYNEPEDDSDLDSDETEFHVHIEVYFIIIVLWQFDKLQSLKTQQVL